MELTIRQLFVNSYNTILDPKTWNQKWFAKDAQGEDCAPSDPNAVCWCSIGSIYKNAGEENRTLGLDLIDIFDNHVWDLMKMRFAQFNDKFTHKEVMTMWLAIGRKQGWVQ